MDGGPRNLWRGGCVKKYNNIEKMKFEVKIKENEEANLKEYEGKKGTKVSLQI